MDRAGSADNLKCARKNVSSLRKGIADVLHLFKDWLSTVDLIEQEMRNVILYAASIY
jgi:hypothetical protein